MGIEPGQSVTNPKRFVRLGHYRATGRSFDDRVGSTAQLLALQSLDTTNLKHEVIFLWVTREEIGLVGSRVEPGGLDKGDCGALVECDAAHAEGLRPVTAAVSGVRYLGAAVGI
ncbi:MAG: M28 family peptidase [Gemmatimonadales bacterium]